MPDRHGARQTPGALVVNRRVEISPGRICLCAARRQVGLYAVVGREGLSGGSGPEHRLVLGIGLGGVVAEEFRLGRILRWRGGQLEASLIEVLARFHDLRAKPDRRVTGLWIRQSGREVRRVDRVAIARGGIDENGNLRPGWPVGEGLLMGPGKAERREDCRDFGFRLDDGDGPQEPRAKRTAQRVGAPDLPDQLAPSGASAAGSRRRSVGLAGHRAGGPLAQAAGLVAVPSVISG